MTVYNDVYKKALSDFDVIGCLMFIGIVV